MSVGMIFGALVMGRFKIKMEKYVYRNIIDGVMFGVGNIFMLMAASAAGNAIAFSFAQLGVIISTIGGILFLGEKKTKRIGLCWNWKCSVRNRCNFTCNCKI